MLEAREERAVWVSREASVLVAVHDAAGRAVPAARVAWLVPPGSDSFDPDHDWWRSVVESQGVTDDGGIARLSDVPCPAGILRVVAEGHQPVVEFFQHLDPRATDPIRVTLDSTLGRGSGALRIEDAETGAPIAEARACSEYGELPGRSDEGGILDLPEWDHLGEFLRVHAPGYCPAFVSTEDESKRVPLFPSARITVHAVTEDGQDVEQALVWLEVDAPPEGTPYPHLPRVRRLRGTSTFDVDVPMSRELRLRGAAASGRSAEVSHTPAAREVDLRLEFSRRDALRLDLRPQSAARTASVVATYEGVYRVDLRPDSTGAFFVPNPEDVGSLAIESLDYVATRLKPLRATEVLRSGSVVVELLPAIGADLRVVSDTGEPLAGMRVSLSARNQPMIDVPARPGFQSTSHPAWIRQVSPLAVGVTDGDGWWRAAGIEAGRYRLAVGVDSSQLFDSDGGRTGFPSQTFEIELFDGAKEVVAVDAPRRVRIEAIQALGGGPVANLFVRDPYSDSVLMSGEQASSVDLWIPRSVQVLEVSSEGMEPRLIQLTADGGSSTYRVGLVPSQPGRIVLEDADGLLPAPPFRVHAYAWGLEGDLLWHGYVHVDDPAQADVHVPLDYAPKVTLELVDGGTGAPVFEPILDEWEPGGELRYRIAAE
jgi:hypothetical protein